MISPESVLSLIRAGWNGLPADAADLVTSNAGNDIHVIPRNPESAAVTVHIDGDMIYVKFGRGLLAEVRISSMPPFRKELGMIDLILKAVMRGLLTEDVWEHDGKLVSSRGEFVIDGKKHRFWFNLLGRVFRRTQRRTYTYAPYGLIKGEH